MYITAYDDERWPVSDAGLPSSASTPAGVGWRCTRSNDTDHQPYIAFVLQTQAVNGAARLACIAIFSWLTRRLNAQSHNCVEIARMPIHPSLLKSGHRPSASNEQLMAALAGLMREFTEFSMDKGEIIDYNRTF